MENRGYAIHDFLHPLTISAVRILPFRGPAVSYMDQPLVLAAVKKDREPSEKGPEGSLALSRCAGAENVAASAAVNNA